MFTTAVQTNHNPYIKIQVLFLIKLMGDCLDLAYGNPLGDGRWISRETIFKKIAHILVIISIKMRKSKVRNKRKCDKEEMLLSKHRCL
jgi:hypothetical protein